jgi:hypothetical protein
MLVRLGSIGLTGGSLDRAREKQGMARLGRWLGYARRKQLGQHIGKKGHGAGPVLQEETRRGEKRRLIVGNWTKSAKGILKRVSNLQNLRFK